MYVSYHWLKDFIKLPAKLTPEDIAEKLTNHTVEVEGLVRQAEQFNNVVIGRVLEVKKHPNADRLKVTVVDVKKKKLTIVCGAPNIAVDQLVPVALVGAILPNGSEIKETEIRGEKSVGMICAEDELGLGKNHEGIMVLSAAAKVGEPFAKYLQADDIVFEVDNKSLSNRPDLWSHYGLARELGAIFSLNLKPYSKLFDKFEFLSAKENKLEIKIEDKELCPRYQAVKIDNITVKESPAWLKERLVAVKQRPINNIVDLTNYVMLELGQPLHAFDADKINKIIVRRAAKNESLETLDEKERILDNEDLVIADSKKAIAIAGVMGGRNSEIDSQTKSLVLEAANFQATAVRKTAQKLNLRSEASIRFEKSLDPNLTEIAILRFLSLLKESCPEMKIASALVDVNNMPAASQVIDLDLKWLADKIGQEIPADKASDILIKLGFAINKDHDPVWRVTVPTWRATKDIKAREDLAEEILRLYGYDNIISALPTQTLNLPEVNQERLLERKIKSILAGKFSLTEIYNYSFVGVDQLSKLKIDFLNYLRLANPLSDVATMLRQSLAPGLIGNIKGNQSKADNLGFFEIGSTFFRNSGNFSKNESGEETLPYQEKHLGLALAGEPDDLFGQMKGIIVNLFHNLFNYRLDAEFSLLENIPGWASSNLAAKISVGGKEIGLVAGINKEAAAGLNLKKAGVITEINFRLLADLVLGQATTRYQETPKYPLVTRDIAFVSQEKILYNDLRNEMIKFNPLIRSVELFDVYSGDKLAAGQKSLAWHLNYQSLDRTLTAAEVDKIQKGLVEHLAKKFAVKLRDF